MTKHDITGGPPGKNMTIHDIPAGVPATPPTAAPALFTPRLFTPCPPSYRHALSLSKGAAF